MLRARGLLLAASGSDSVRLALRRAGAGHGRPLKGPRCLCAIGTAFESVFSSHGPESRSLSHGPESRSLNHGPESRSPDSPGA